jgi:hypothetical protein
MKALRKLVLGETWALPIGIAVAVAIAGVLRVVAGPGGWWEQAGGFVLLALLVAAFAVAVVPRR